MLCPCVFMCYLFWVVNLLTIFSTIALSILDAARDVGLFLPLTTEQAPREHKETSSIYDS